MYQGTWEEVASLKEARAGCAAGAAEGTLVVAGGDSESAGERAFYRARTSLASVELYQPRDNLWRAGPPLPHSRAEAGAALLWPITRTNTALQIISQIFKNNILG